MFTLKFRHRGGWDIYATDRYQVIDYDEEKHVHFTPAEDEPAITCVISPDEYNACYVVNAGGETVDRIHPPSEKV